MLEITYHRASLTDVQTLVDYRIEFLLCLMGPQTTDAITELKRNLYNYFNETLLNNNYISYIAKHGNEIVGIGGMALRVQPGSIKNPTGKFGYLLGMYTIPLYRRKGICSKILDLLIAEGKNSGVTAFELHATKDGEYVYTQHGFEPHIEPTYRKYI